MADQAQLTVPTDAELLQAQADLWRHSLYYMTSMAFQCAVKLRIPTTIHGLGGAASLPDLVIALSLPPAKLTYLRRIMRLLATSGVFATTGVDVYRLTPIYLLLDGVDLDGHPSQTSVVLAATSRHCVEAALGLADWFRKDVAGSPFEDLHGVILFDGSMAEAEPEIDAELLQAQADLWRHSLYYMTSMAFQCAVKLGIPTTIHGLGGAASLPDLVTAVGPAPNAECSPV